MLNNRFLFLVILSGFILFSASFAETVTTTVDNVPLQVSPTSQRVLRLIPKGTSLEKTGESGVFFRVIYSGQEGYIYKNYTFSEEKFVDSYIDTNGSNSSGTVTKLNTTSTHDFCTLVKKVGNTKTYRWSVGGKVFESTGTEGNYEPFKSNYLTFKNTENSRINPEFGKRLENLAKDKGKINITSGFRSMETQIKNIQNYYNNNPGVYTINDKGGLNRNGKNYVGSPQGTKHKSGIAVDVGNQTYKDMSNSQLKNYSLQKPLSYENWHIEPIESRN